jgi:opacity protein-like surface antigen
MGNSSGVSFNPISLKNQRITLSADALHPNNNGESVNLGLQYAIDLLGTGTLFLRAGYKALFMSDSEYGMTLGGGVLIRFMGNLGIKMDYAYKPLGILGNTHCYTVSMLF